MWTHSGPQTSSFYPSSISFQNWCDTPPLNLFSLTLICCLRPEFVVPDPLYIVTVWTSAATVKTSISLFLSTLSTFTSHSSIQFHIIPFFKVFKVHRITTLHMAPSDLNIIWHKIHFLRAACSKTYWNAWKSGPPETSQLCEYSEIYSVSLEMFATRGKCFKKMNTWNLTLLSFIDSSAERTSYFKCSGALQLSSALWVVLNIVSAHCQEEGCIGLFILSPSAGKDWF